MSLDAARRIVCLTEEPAEILCELGCEDRIVGVSAYAVRPTGIAQRKPVVTAFTGGSVQKICALEPDLCIGFSDVQADFAAELVRAGLQVLIFNQRSVAEILEVVLCVGRLVGRESDALGLARGYRDRLESLRKSAPVQRPRVYFEEWDDPLICGSHWVSELIEIAGGLDVFASRAAAPKAADRQVQWSEVLEAAPEVVLASWCGKAFDESALRARSRSDEVPAVRDDAIHEVDAAIILQPGPAALTDGVDRLVTLLQR